MHGLVQTPKNPENGATGNGIAKRFFRSAWQGNMRARRAVLVKPMLTGNARFRGIGALRVRAAACIVSSGREGGFTRCFVACGQYRDQDGARREPRPIEGLRHYSLDIVRMGEEETEAT